MNHQKKLKRGGRKPSPGLGYRSTMAGERGQALAEMVIGFIALAVLFLGTLFLADLCRARTRAILESRPDAGSVAMSGFSKGSPTCDIDSERLHSDVLAITHDPIDYCSYKPPDYLYISNNLVEPLITGGDLIGAFGFVVSEKTYYVTNAPFLRQLKVTPNQDLIGVTEKTCIPQMKDFP